MHRINGAILSVLIALLAASCSGVSESPKTYFDSLINAQEAQLTGSNASVFKKASLENTTSESTFIPGAEWSGELAIFRQLAVMERPAFRRAYTIEDSLKDTRSNLMVRRYSTDENIPVTKVEFFYRHRFGELKKIEAVYQQNSLLYTTTRRLTMEFDDSTGKPVLSKYTVTGVQKMILGSPVEFSIESRVVN